MHILGLWTNVPMSFNTISSIGPYKVIWYCENGLWKYKFFDWKFPRRSEAIMEHIRNSTPYSTLCAKGSPERPVLLPTKIVGKADIILKVEIWNLKKLIFGPEFMIIL